MGRSSWGFYPVAALQQNLLFAFSVCAKGEILQFGFGANSKI